MDCPGKKSACQWLDSASGHHSKQGPFQWDTWLTPYSADMVYTFAGAKGFGAGFDAALILVEVA